MDGVFIIKHNSPEYLEAVALRREVLRIPLGLEFSSEELEAEFSEIQLGLWTNHQLLAVLSLKPLTEHEVKMRQVAVRPDYQNIGLGKQLVRASESVAKDRGFQCITLHARDTAIPFYLNLGYESVGLPFEEVGIPHMKMKKVIG